MNFLISILILCLITFIMPDSHKNDVEVPLDAKNYKGENYEIVIKQLEAAGFENIDTEIIADLSNEFLKKDGKVENVSIAENTEFKKGTYFSKDSQVMVTYHTFKDKNKDKE